MAQAWHCGNLQFFGVIGISRTLYGRWFHATAPIMLREAGEASKNPKRKAARNLSVKQGCFPSQTPSTMIVGRDLPPSQMRQFAATKR